MEGYNLSQADNLDVEALQRMIAELTNENKELKKQKKFGLVWEDKPDAQVLRVRDEAPMLREDTLKAVVTDEKAQNHILINGDNFHALTALRATHAGKIDVIYIDPPYNTGNKDFIYNDSYLDKEDGYRHSKWLSFMEKRLSLAKELLSESGVIFVSIDDNEQARLKLLMDEVFGPENFIDTFIWEKTQHTGRQKLNSYKNTEFILSYAKKLLSQGVLSNVLIESSQEVFEDAPLLNKGNNDHMLTFPKGSTFFKTGETHFPGIRGPYNLLDEVKVKQDTDVDGFYYSNEEPFRLSFKSRWSQRELNDQISKGTKFLVKTSGFAIRALYGASKEAKTVAPWTLIRTSGGGATKSRHGVSVGTTSRGSTEVATILGESAFSYPKPVSLVGYLISLVSNADALVLDFFAGSGTTAHAVAELNKEDGGNRQCILVTDGGKTETTGESSKNGKDDAVNIVEEITYERVRRVLTGKDWADGKEHEPSGGNLRYFKVEMEPAPHGMTPRDQRLGLEKYTIEHAKIATNIFNEVDSKNELDDELGLPIDYKVFAGELNARYLVGVNAHDYALSDLEEWFKNLPEESAVTVVGNGLEQIEWISKNSDRITVDDVLGRVIRSRKHVASKLPLI